MATFLDDISIYNAKAAVVIKNLSLSGNYERVALLSSLKTTANDIALTDEVRLNALTALINKAQLLDIPLGPYFPSVISFQPTEIYAGIHNLLDGLNSGDYLHLTLAEYTKLINLPNNLSSAFVDITGEPTDNANLNAALLLKEDAITASTASKFLSWDKTFRDIDYGYITNKPSTLAGYGITAADTLFDNKYVAQSSVINSFVVGANTPVTNANTLVQAIGNLQAQINYVSASSGTLNTVGIAVPPSFFINVSNSPLTGNGGDISFSLASQAANAFFAAPSGGSGLPSFRPIDATDFPVVPGLATGVYGNASQYPVLSIDNRGRITGVTLQNAGGTGTVQSVTVNMPSPEFASSGNPITLSGTITFAWQNQAQKKVFAGPVSGAASTPGFRLLEKTDIPNIDISQVNELAAALSNNDNLNTLSFGQIWIGNNAEQPEQKTITGVIALDSDGLTTVNDDSISLNALEYINPNTILGRYDSPSGAVQTIALSNDFVISPTGTLSLDTPVAPVITSAGQLLTYNSTASPPAQAALPAPTAGQVLLGYPGRPAPDGYGLIWQTLGGVISGIDHTTGVVSLSNDSIDYIKLKNSTGNNILLGRAGGAGAIVELSGTQAATIIDAFNGGAKGLVPAIASPDATKFLAGDGTWITPSGGGSPGGSGNQVQYRTGATTFGGIPYMAFDSQSGEIRTAGPNFLLVDDVTTVGKSVFFDISAINNQGESWSFPNTSDTFVGESYIQNITNKTLGTGTAINLGSPATGTMWYDGDGNGTLTEIDPTNGAGKYLSLDGSLTPIWTGVTVSSTANIDGGAANQILYQTGASTTSFITVPTTADTFLKWDGGAFAWATAGSGSGTVNSGGLKELAYYNAAGTAVSGLPVSVSNGTFFLSQVITAGVPANPVWTGVTGTGLVVLDDTPIIKQPRIGQGVGNGHLHIYRGNTPVGLANYATLAFLSASKTMSIEFETDGFQSQFLFAAAASTKTYTFPNATGSVVINTTVPSFTNGSSEGEIRLLEAAANGTNYVAVKSPSVLGGNLDLVLPSNSGTSGYVLQTDGFGNLSWINNGGSINSSYIVDSTETSITGTTVETINKTLLIPSNTFKTNTAFRILARLRRSDPAFNVVGIRIYINTVANLTGTPLLVGGLISWASGATLTGVTVQRNFLVINANSQTTYNLLTTTGAYSDTTGIYNNSAIDWTQNQYVIITTASSNAAYTSYVRAIQIIPE